MFNGKHQIKKIDLTDEHVYRIICEDCSLYIVRKTGNIRFAKFFSVSGDDVNNFEIRHNNGRAEIYLHIRYNSEPHTMYVGETTGRKEEKEEAENWVSLVNQFYEDRRKNNHH